MNKGTNTGFNGVTRRMRNTKEKFQCYLAHNGTTIHIGTYNTIEEAVKGRVKFIMNLI